MNIVEIVDHHLVNWKEDKNGFGLATFTFPVDHGVVVKDTVLVYHGLEYRILRITIDRRQIIFRKIVDERNDKT